MNVQICVYMCMYWKPDATMSRPPCGVYITYIGLCQEYEHMNRRIRYVHICVLYTYVCISLCCVCSLHIYRAV